MPTARACTCVGMQDIHRPCCSSDAHVSQKGLGRFFAHYRALSDRQAGSGFTHSLLCAHHYPLHKGSQSAHNVPRDMLPAHFLLLRLVPRLSGCPGFTRLYFINHSETAKPLAQESLLEDYNSACQTLHVTAQPRPWSMLTTNGAAILVLVCMLFTTYPTRAILQACSFPLLLNQTLKGTRIKIAQYNTCCPALWKLCCPQQCPAPNCSASNSPQLPSFGVLHRLPVVQDGSRVSAAAASAENL